MLLLPLLLLPLALAAPAQNYVNTAIARTIELGGATTSSQTQYSVKALSDSPGVYYLALSTSGDGVAADWWEVSVGGKAQEAVRAVQDGHPMVRVDLGPLKKDEPATISLAETTVRASTALPGAIEQRESQYLLWRSNTTYVESWYKTDVERVKIRSPTPNILSYPEIPTTYTRDNTVTRSGATLTLGPFHNLPPTLGSAGEVQQAPFSVHYEHKDPVVALRTLKRGVEVSHWGANVNIQDEMDLVNIGPTLKGHFSRLAHQQSRFHASTPAQIFTELHLRLPPQAHSVYYYDTIGNVSTSHFRPGSIPSPVPAGSAKKIRAQRAVDGAVDLRPRYPILGGWNYSFVVGYDQPAGDVLKTLPDGKKVLGVPFFQAVKDLVVDQMEMEIVLPEGAKDVEVFAPFELDSITHSIIKTYLDTTGRPTVTLRKRRCTENHGETIYVTYSFPTSALVKKPLTVAGVVGGLFLLAMGVRRVDWSIEKKKRR